MIANSDRIKKLMRREARRAQGMTEYIIIVGLIGILLVGAVMNFKDALNNAFTKGAGEITAQITNKMS